MGYCVFCEIVAGREPGTVIYEDDEFIVLRNILGWIPVQYLAMTKIHTTQDELWNGYMGRLAPIATQIGNQLCPDGFRLVSNFGFNAMQSQPHGHLHILGGTFLGHYIG